MHLSTIVNYLDQLLWTSEVRDYPQAHNGLQLANSGTVKRVAVAVDACLPVIEEAIAAEADLLIVHHGLFWSGLQPITGAYYQKLKLALQHGLAIYSSHLPLDRHPKFGNNILLANALGLRKLTPALKIQGELVGMKGICKPILRTSFLELVSKAVGRKVHLAPGNSEMVQKVLVVTGGAGSNIATAAKEGVDTFVTGEGPHWSYTMAEELGVNLIYAGHYATETFGVKALGALLKQEFDLPHSFIDHPTGL
ncbi:MAG: Nif3-like dinuclear metal center hexameric protein [Verrucomicrobiae bacterium]|nr:Nif3-like dinuclear metal center hexameric protein [Verrucomicrobiae bacterium]